MQRATVDARRNLHGAQRAAAPGIRLGCLKDRMVDRDFRPLLDEARWDAPRLSSALACQEASVRAEDKSRRGPGCLLHEIGQRAGV